MLLPSVNAKNYIRMGGKHLQNFHSGRNMSVLLSNIVFYLSIHSFKHLFDLLSLVISSVGQYIYNCLLISTLKVKDKQ